MRDSTSIFQRAPLDPYIIAEIGVNHEGSLERAKAQISAVARAGGHAAKFQTYTSSLLASEHSSPAYWDTSKEPTTSQYELFRKYDGFGPDDYRALAAHCADEGIDFLSTPFDLDAVEMLDPIVPAFKIASADLTNLPLLRRVAKTGKPVLMSVGAATTEEIDWAVDELERAGTRDLAILHCVLNYPTPPDVAEIGAVKRLRDRYGQRHTVGYSDHVAPGPGGELPALEMATLYGASVLEKHFTDDRSAPGNDHYHATDEEGLRAFVAKLATYRALHGMGTEDLQHQEAAITNARRRVFVARDLEPGHTLTESDLIALRADTGLPIRLWDSVVGSTLTQSKRAREPLFEGDLTAPRLS